MDEQVFRREGDYWTVTFAGSTHHLRDSRGLRYIGCLLTRPGQEISSWELLLEASGPDGLPVAERRRRSSSKDEAAASPLRLERARVTVTKSIKTALERIRESSPELADHLDATIRRGYACVYRPDPRVPIRWETTGGHGL